MPRVYLIVGPSCAGKTQFATNAFMYGRHAVEKHDLLTYCEAGDTALIGKWLLDKKVRGTDKVSRADIDKFYDQTERLLARDLNVVLEGERIYSRPFCKRLSEAGIETVIVYIRCSVETSLRRSHETGQTASDRFFETVAKKAENLYEDVKGLPNFTGVVIDTDGIEELSEFETFGRGWRYGEDEEDRFCVFVLSHGRADNVKTVKTLEKQGYTGDWYVVIDNEDEQEDRYKELFGDKVVVFDKIEQSKKFDTMDLSEDRRSVVYARNACFRIARQLGYRYFLELDDDYTSFEYRYVEDEKLKVKKPNDLNGLFSAYLQFLKDTGAATVAMAQGGDLIGGKDSPRFKERVLRKAMNTFFCDVKNPFKFTGRINEDVNTYVLEGSRGVLMLTAVDADVTQERTQSSEGGMSGMYRDNGTYLKSFYSVMVAPSCVKVSVMQTSNPRIHHSVQWNNAVPKILNECWRKR